jgi:hypothetical protein
MPLFNLGSPLSFLRLQKASGSGDKGTPWEVMMSHEVLAQIGTPGPKSL